MACAPAGDAMNELRDGEVLVVTYEGESLDAYAATELRTRIASRIEEGWRYVVLDLSSVRFLDSTGLGVLVHLHKRAARGGRFVLCGVGEMVLDVLRLTRMDRALSVVPTAADAIRACRPAA